MTPDQLSKIESAKALLRNHGFAVDNLYNVRGIQMFTACTDEEAQEIISSVLDSDEVYKMIQEKCWNFHLKSINKNGRRKTRKVETETKDS